MLYYLAWLWIVAVVGWFVYSAVKSWREMNANERRGAYQGMGVALLIAISVIAMVYVTAVDLTSKH